MDANTIIAISSIVTPISVMLATVLVARMQQQTKTSVDLGNVATNEIHEAVKVSDGVTIGSMIETSTARDVAQDATEEH